MLRNVFIHRRHDGFALFTQVSHVICDTVNDIL